MAVGTGQIADGLAVSLSKVESALEQNADYAGSHGVPVGTDGTPPTPYLGQEPLRGGYLSAGL